MTGVQTCALPICDLDAFAVSVQHQLPLFLWQFLPRHIQIDLQLVEQVTSVPDVPGLAILVAELARELQRSEAAVRAMLFRRRINGDVWQVSEARFMLREHVAALVAAAAALDAAAASGFTAAQFRDATGVGRNFTIQLLEFFDRIGVTLRLGDLRRIRADYEVVVASGEM